MAEPIDNLKNILGLKDYSCAEEEVLKCVLVGAMADFSSGDPELDDPENAAKWDEGYTIRAEFLRRLCIHPETESLVRPVGVVIKGAKISGVLDFTGALILHNLWLEGCAIEEGITLSLAEAKSISLEGSLLGPVHANGLSVKGSVFLNGVKAKGGVRLPDANIGGQLNCEGAEFENEGKIAFGADGLSVKGSVILSGVKAKGEARLPGADIGSQLVCNGAKFENGGGYAFNADGLSVKGGVFLSIGESEGKVRNFKTKGEVRLVGADIGGTLNCDGSEFENEGEVAFFADWLSVKGSAFFRGVESKGVVRLLGADIGGELNCNGAAFENERGVAFGADGLLVKGSVFLSKVESKGKARNFKAKGEVRFVGAKIEGQLACEGGEFENEGGYAFCAEHFTVDQGLLFRDMKINGFMNLAFAKVGTLVDDSKSWPSEGSLLLDGFEYSSIVTTSPISAEERLKWLRLQPKTHKGKKLFFPQPYEQLARVLHRMGHEADARKILIAKQNDLRERGVLSRCGKLWNRLLGMTVGHGYQPWRAVLWSVFIILLGTGIFWGAYEHKIIQPSKERVYMDAEYKADRKLPDEYPRFNPIIYSLDVFVPFVDLHQENYWLPDATRPKGWWFRLYFWAHIAFGWVFSTLAALSLAGVVRKDKL